MARQDPLANPEEAVRRVYAYAAYRLGDGAEAEDVTSATIERALRCRSSYDFGKGDPAAWLVGIARRTIDEHYRRQVLSETVASVPAVDTAAGAVAHGRAMAAAVGRLEPQERHLIALRYGAGLTMRQAAEVLHQRPAVIEAALQRALARLRSVVDATRAGRGMNEFGRDLEFELGAFRPAPRDVLLDRLILRIGPRPSPSRGGRWQLRIAGVLAVAALLGLAGLGGISIAVNAVADYGGVPRHGGTVEDDDNQDVPVCLTGSHRAFFFSARKAVQVVEIEHRGVYPGAGRCPTV